MSPKILKKLRQARWRMELARFGTLATRGLTLTLSLGVVALAGGKIVPLPWLDDTGSVLLGAITLGLVAAAAWALLTRRDALAAAVELDRRFNLKERVSTLVALGPEDGSAGAPRAARQALAADAEARLEGIVVGDQFGLKLPERFWLPGVPAALLVVLGSLVGPFDWFDQKAAANPSEVERERIATETKVLEKRLAERRAAAAMEGVDAKLGDLTAKVEEAAREIGSNKKIAAEDAVLKLNELARSVEERQKELASAEQIRRHLAKMQTITDGPAADLAKALKRGDLDEAAKRLEDLQTKLKEGGLAAEDKAKLVQQLQRMQQEMERAGNLADRAEQLKRSLSGPKLEEELAKLARDQERMQELKELAQRLGECSECLGKEGDGGDAAQRALAQAKEALDRMRQDDKASQLLDNLLDDMAVARAGMCQGDQEGRPGRRDHATGRGRGAGTRDEKADETKGRVSRSPSGVGKGPVTIAGKAEGETFRGESRLELRAAAEAAASAADEAITRQKVPRDYREHARDYFSRLNGQLKD